MDGVKPTATLSSLARYTWDRARKCSRVENKNNNLNGYPGLAPTELGVNPPCVGLSSTPASGWEGYLTGSGNDMEGEFGRTHFVVNTTQKMVLKTGKRYYSDINHHSNQKGKRGLTILSVSLRRPSTGPQGSGTDAGGSYYDWVHGNCDLQAHRAPNTFIHTQGTTWKGRGYFTLHFNGIDHPKAKQRINRQGGWTMCDIRKNCGGQQHTPAFWPYCADFSNIADPWAVHDFGHFGTPYSSRQAQPHTVEITLCPGDEGYIQANKGDPSNKGEWSKHLGEKKIYSFLHITKLGDDPNCP